MSQREYVRVMFEGLNRIYETAQRSRSHPDDLEELSLIKRELERLIYETGEMVSKSLKHQGLFITPGARVIAKNDCGQIETVTLVGVISASYQMSGQETQGLSRQSQTSENDKEQEDKGSHA